MNTEEKLQNGKRDALADAFNWRKFSDFFRTWRLMHAYASYDRVARWTGISKAKIRRIEIGEVEPSFREAIVLCKIMGSPLHAFDNTSYFKSWDLMVIEYSKIYEVKNDTAL